MSFFYLIPSSVLLYKDRHRKVLTIEPIPEDCSVKLFSKGYVQDGNSISVVKGHTVEWTVSRPYYYPQSGKIILTKNTILPVELEEFAHCVLTLNIDQPDPTITFTSIDGDQISDNQYWVHKGSTINYRIYKSGFFIETGSITLEEDVTLDINLETSYNVIYTHEIGNPALIYTGQEEL